MYLSYPNFRLGSEPLLLIIKVFNIDIISINNKEHTILTNDQVEVIGFKNIWDYLVLKNDKNLVNIVNNQSIENSFEYQATSQLYELLIECLLFTKREHNLERIIQILDQIVAYILTNKFIFGEILTSIDLLLYESVMTIFDTSIVPLNLQFIKYAQRIEAQPIINDYIYDDDFLKRNYLPNQLSKLNKAKKVISENLNLLSDMATINGCLVASKINYDLNQEAILSNIVSLSCYPKIVRKMDIIFYIL